jgi:FkbM family methyltransferase
MSEVFERNLIYDVGMHKGEDSEFYLKKGFRVVAIEASAALAQAASERFQEYIGSGQLVVLNVAIAEKDGPLTFFANPGVSVWGTTDPQWAERNRKMGQSSVETTVNGVNFANILSKHGIPYYLKIDIEGADTLCLKGLKGLTVKPKHVSIESTKTSWKSLMEEFAIFKELGYTKFKAIPQHTVETQVCPYPAKEGVYADHQFKFDASGLFGEELTGEWMNEAEILRVYRRIFLQYRLYGDDGLAAKVWRALRPNSLPAEGEKSQSAGGSSSGKGKGGLAKIRGLIRRLRPNPGWYDTHATTP